jgi:plasmid stabilization system protein ParE
MDFKLIISREAHADIDEITEYIARKLRNPQAASGFLDDVEKSYRSVVKNPHLHALCTDKRLRDKGYCRIIIKNYLIFYRVDEAENTIYIVRVIYGPRDYAKLL